MSTNGKDEQIPGTGNAVLVGGEGTSLDSVSESRQPSGDDRQGDASDDAIGSQMAGPGRHAQFAPGATGSDSRSAPGTVGLNNPEPGSDMSSASGGERASAGINDSDRSSTDGGNSLGA